MSPAQTAPAASSAPDPAAVGRFEIARFGAALLPDAKEEEASESAAMYLTHARFSAIADFYRAVYGSQKGMIVDVTEEPESVIVAVGKRVKDADFSMILVTPHPNEEPNRFRVMVMARAEDDDEDEGYPDSSPWAEPND